MIPVPTCSAATSLMWCLCVFLTKTTSIIPTSRMIRSCRHNENKLVPLPMYIHLDSINSFNSGHQRATNARCSSDLQDQFLRHRHPIHISEGISLLTLLYLAFGCKLLSTASTHSCSLDESMKKKASVLKSSSWKLESQTKSPYWMLLKQEYKTKHDDVWCGEKSTLW